MHDFNHQPDADSIRHAQGRGSETARALRLAATGWPCNGGGLLSAGGKWRTWLVESFEHVIGPHFVSVFNHAGQMQVREITSLDASLPDGKQSRASGRDLLEMLITTRSSRLAGKLAALCPSPHLATAVAVQAVEFHLPLRQALLGCLFFEWLGLHPDGDIETFLRDEAAFSGHISRVIQQSFGDFQNAFSA